MASAVLSVDLKARALTLGRALSRLQWWEMTPDQAWDHLVAQCGDLERLDAYEVAMSAMSYVMAHAPHAGETIVGELLERAEDPAYLCDALVEGR